MKEEEKLLKLNLKREHKKSNSSKAEGLQLNFFKTVYLLLENEANNDFRDIFFLILQFLQLMAFTMNQVFSSGWKTHWFGVVGHFFEFCQMVPLWSGNSQFYIISYIVACLYILVFLLLVVHILTKISNHTFKSKTVLSVLLEIFEFETALNIPFLKILFAVFTCNDNDKLVVAPDIKCKSGTQICLMIISIIFALILVFFIVLFKMTFYDFASIHGKLKAAYTSSTEVLLVIMKFILVIIFQFIKKDMALALLTLVISLFLFFEFLGKKPFVNGFVERLYFSLYLLFCWSSFICVMALLLKNSKFEGGVILLLLGYPFIILAVYFTELEFTVQKIFDFSRDIHKDAYKTFFEIQFFSKLEDSLEDKIRTKEQKLLYSYINNHELSCINKHCPLKVFLEIPLETANFPNMKIYLLQHMEVLFKNAVAKFPFNAKLRLSYGLFLYQRLNKKQKGANEIFLLNNFHTNLEDSFLIYKAQRTIQDENEGLKEENSSKLKNSINYTAILKNVRTLIWSITMNYIDFWTILAVSDENKSENFQKMSKIGSTIRTLTEELSDNVDRLEKVNLYDQDGVKLYSQYLTEVLNDYPTAVFYTNKVIELEQKKHQYNEENLIDLNYKEMSRSEKYNYLVINCSQDNFGIICNLSLSVCPLFGFSREELIGRSLDFILPELFVLPHRQLLLDRIDSFKNTMLIKNKNIRVRSDSKILETVVKTKMKYLVPVKLKVCLVSSEEDTIYGICKIIYENKTTTDIEQEISYVLTDRDFIVRNFSPSAPKLLNLHYSSINNNLDLTKYIKGFIEEVFLNVESNFGENSNSKIFKQIKKQTFKSTYLRQKKLIHWKLGDVSQNDLFRKRDSSLQKLRAGLIKQNSAEPKSQSALGDFSVRPILKSKLKTSFLNKKVGYKFSSDVKKHNSTIEEKDNNCIVEKQLNNDNKEGSNVSDVSNGDGGMFGGDKGQKNNYFNKKVYHKFNLSVEEVKINQIKIGYLFMFELYGQNTVDTNSNNNQKNKAYNLIQSNNKMDYSEIDKSDISVVSFANKQPDPKPIVFNATSDNPNGINLGLDDTFIPKIEKESEFTIDLNTSSYKQFGTDENLLNNINPYETLRQEAIEKIAQVAGHMKKHEENEEEEEEESYEYSEDDDENNSSKNDSEASEKIEIDGETPLSSKNDLSNELNKISQRNNNEKSGKDLQQNIISAKSGNNNVTPKNKPENITNNFNFNNVVKHKEVDYYHVDTSKITYYVYNYATGFVEALKDNKFKISQVIKQTNAQKESLSKMSAKFIANPKLAKDKKKVGTGNKKSEINDDEADSYSENKIKLKEIQRALSSKEKQTAIINLCIFSFVVFVLIIGASIVNLIISSLLKNILSTYFKLFENTVLLDLNIIVEANYLREIIFIPNKNYYTNRYDNLTNDTTYYKSYIDASFNLYLKSSYILSNLSTVMNTLHSDIRKQISEEIVTLYVIDPTRSKDGIYNCKSYNLTIQSAYHELNAALYHITQLKFEEVNAYDDSLFYFFKNGINSILVYAEKQLEIVKNEFIREGDFGNVIIIICIVVSVVDYAICFTVFVYFYKKVEERKQSYLSVFYEIGVGFIIHSLNKCEKFSHKIQLEDNSNIAENLGEKISLNTSSNDDSDMDTDLCSTSSVKKSKENKINLAHKEKTTSNTSHLKITISGFIVLLIFLMVQIVSYIYYYNRINLYNNLIHYSFYEVKSITHDLLPFLGVREYIYQGETIFSQNMSEYLKHTALEFYTTNAKYSKEKNKYKNYLPQRHIDRDNTLFSTYFCELIENFMKQYPLQVNNQTKCEYFFYNTSSYGFYSLLTAYFEDLRTLRDYLEKQMGKNVYNYTYNESYFNTEYYANYYADCMKEDNCTKYNETNPAQALSTDLHSRLLIVFKYVFVEISDKLLENLTQTINDAFDKTSVISLIINIIFMVVVFVGFCFVWLPFVAGENETIYKTKNMLSIIPKEILVTLPHINIMLGIDDEKSK